jgi:hypothetical protein
VAGSAVKARAATWQVAQDWRPEADRLTSEKIACPANAAADIIEVAGGDVESVEPPPPHPLSESTAANQNAAWLHPFLSFEFIDPVLPRPWSASMMRVRMLSRMIRICNNSPNFLMRPYRAA